MLNFASIFYELIHKNIQESQVSVQHERIFLLQALKDPHCKEWHK